MDPSEETSHSPSAETDNATSPSLQPNLEHDAPDLEGDAVEAKPVHSEASATSRLASTAASLDKLLCSSLRGNFYEEGTSLNDKHRPEQLRVFYEIREEISEVRSENKALKTQSAQAEKSGPISTKKLKETIAEIVKQESAPRFRDEGIRYERLEEELKGEKGRNDKLEQTVKDRDGKEDGKFKKYEEQIAALNRAVKKANEDREKANRQLQEHGQALAEKTAEIRQLKETNAELDSQVNALKAEVQSCASGRQKDATQLARSTSDLQLTMRILGGLQDEVTTFKQHVEEELEPVKCQQENDRRELRNVDIELRRLASHSERLDELLRGDYEACRSRNDRFDQRLKRLERR